MAIVKLSATERRRVSAFVTCLVIAVFAWFFTTLSNPYRFTVKQVLNFKNGPQTRAFHSLQSDTVNATVLGNGWQMLFSNMDAEQRVINVDLNTLEHNNYVVLSSQIKQINNKKLLNNEILTFNPDTLFFDFSNRTVKKVPIKLVTSLNYERQFAQAGVVTLNPAYVMLNGPAEVLARIKSWPTDSVIIDHLNNSFNKQVKLQPVKEGNLSILPKSVAVNIPVDEFTEKTVEIPVKLINNPDFYDVRIFPQKVRLTFTTSLTDYPDMDEDDFEAVADLTKWRRESYKMLPVKIIHLPAYSKVVKIEPQNVDFIVKK